MLTKPARFEKGRQGIILRKTALFDDPLNLTGSLLSLKQGEQVNVLYEGYDACYVEVIHKGQRFWGFVRVEDVQPAD